MSNKNLPKDELSELQAKLETGNISRREFVQRLSKMGFGLAASYFIIQKSVEAKSSDVKNHSANGLVRSKNPVIDEILVETEREIDTTSSDKDNSNDELAWAYSRFSRAYNRFSRAYNRFSR